MHRRSKKGRSPKGQGSSNKVDGSLSLKDFPDRSISQKKSSLKKVKIVKIPADLITKKSKMLFILFKAGKQWEKVSPEYGLQCCGLPSTKRNKNYWYKIKSLYKKSSSKFSLGLFPLYTRLKRSFHNWHGNVKALPCFDVKKALSQGWIQTKAKNHYLLWKSKLGRIEWFPSTGHIRIIVFKPFSEGKKKQLLADGFYGTNLVTDINVFVEWVENVRYKGHHTTIETGIKQPYFKEVFTDPFEMIVVKGGDKSDRTKIEIERELTALGFKLEEMLLFCGKNIQQDIKVRLQNIKTIESFNDLLKQITTPQPLKKDASRTVV